MRVCFQVLERSSLPAQALARLEFGEHLVSMLGLGDAVKLEVAQNLPPARLRAGGSAKDSDDESGVNANAFRNSYRWDPAAGVLYVHGTRALMCSLLNSSEERRGRDTGGRHRALLYSLLRWRAIQSSKHDECVQRMMGVVPVNNDVKDMVSTVGKA